MTQLALGHALRTHMPIIGRRLLAVFEVTVEHHYAAPWKTADRRLISIHPDVRG